MNKKYITALAVMLLALLACGRGCRDNNDDDRSDREDRREQRENRKEKKEKDEDSKDGEERFVFGNPVMLQNSQYALIPVRLANNDEDIFNILKREYNDTKNNIFSSHGHNYNSLGYDDLYNVIFYNKITGETHPMLNSRIYIGKFFLPSQSALDTAGTTFMLFTTTNKDNNNDEEIDSDDGETVYLCDSTGRDIRQITQDGVQLLGWEADRKADIIFLTVNTDSNMDDRFTYKDEIKILKTLISNPQMATEVIPDSLKTELKTIYK